jgi:RNA polymerase sigma-70 factor (ECF subfamily)
VILLAVFGLGGSPAGPAPASAALNRLARLIAAQPLTPKPGQYLYLESRSAYPAFSGSCATVAVDHRQIWVGADGSGLDRNTEEPERFTSAADRAGCLRADPEMRLRSGGTSDDWNAPRCLVTGIEVDWSKLSSDPHVLLQQMRQRDGGPTTPGEDFQHIGDFLRNTTAPPAVRATLYQAAALIPGIQLLGAVRDHNGRPGLGIAYPSEGPYPEKGASSELIFDQQTGKLLGERGHGPLGSYWAVYLSEKVVNGLPSKPPAPLTPPCSTPGRGIAHHIPGGLLSTGP